MRKGQGSVPITVTCLLLLLVAAHGPAADWKEALESQLRQHYKPAKRQTFGLGDNFTPGSVLVLQKPGIRADLRGARNKRGYYHVNRVEAGRLAEEGGGSGFLGAEDNALPLSAGERLYLTETQINPGVLGAKCRDDDKLDCVRLKLVTTDTKQFNVAGTTQVSRLETAIEFSYPKGSLATADLAQVLDGIHPFLKSEEEVAAGPSKSVELGQTPDQVREILGPPDNTVKLGEKTILVYKSLKVVFIGGRSPTSSSRKDFRQRHVGPSKLPAEMADSVGDSASGVGGRTAPMPSGSLLGARQN